MGIYCLKQQQRQENRYLLLKTTTKTIVRFKIYIKIKHSTIEALRKGGIFQDLVKTI